MSGLGPPTEVCVVGTPDTGGVADLTALPGDHATTTDTDATAAISVRTNARTHTVEVGAITQAAHPEIDPSHLAPVDVTEAAKTRIVSGVAVPTDEAGEPTRVGGPVLRDARPLPMSSSCFSRR